MKTYDIYSYGVISSSTLYTLNHDFPNAEGYSEINERLFMTGGEAANSSIVLANLGARVKLDGNWIGDEDNGRRTKNFLDSRNIDTSRLIPKKDYKGVEEVVFADKDTRTIFGTYCRLQEEKGWNKARKEDIINSQVVCLDPFFGDESIEVSKIASSAGIPFVTVDLKFDTEIVKNSSAIVIAESFIRENYSDWNIENLLKEYQKQTDGLIIFTFGNKEILYCRGNEDSKKVLPYSVNTLDTTGGGDSFRAGIVYGILKGWCDKRAVEFASALAAIVCMRFPGVINSPTLKEVEDFIAERK